MFNGRRQPSNDGTSRMTRECQVRFCERLGVKFPGPTRQNENPPLWGLCQLPPAADMRWMRPCPDQFTLSRHSGRSPSSNSLGVGMCAAIN